MADGTYKPGPVVSLSLPGGWTDHYIDYGLPGQINHFQKIMDSSKKEQDIKKKNAVPIQNVLYNFNPECVSLRPRFVAWLQPRHPYCTCFTCPSNHAVYCFRTNGGRHVWMEETQEKTKERRCSEMSAAEHEHGTHMNEYKHMDERRDGKHRHGRQDTLQGKPGTWNELKLVLLFRKRHKHSHWQRAD